MRIAESGIFPPLDAPRQWLAVTFCTAFYSGDHGGVQGCARGSALGVDAHQVALGLRPAANSEHQQSAQSKIHSPTLPSPPRLRPPELAASSSLRFGCAEALFARGGVCSCPFRLKTVKIRLRGVPAGRRPLRCTARSCPWHRGDPAVHLGANLLVVSRRAPRAQGTLQ